MPKILLIIFLIPQYIGYLLKHLLLKLLAIVYQYLPKAKKSSKSVFKSSWNNSNSFNTSEYENTYKRSNDMVNSFDEDTYFDNQDYFQDSSVSREPHKDEQREEPFIVKEKERPQDNFISGIDIPMGYPKPNQTLIKVSPKSVSVGNEFPSFHDIPKTSLDYQRRLDKEKDDLMDVDEEVSFGNDLFDSSVDSEWYSYDPKWYRLHEKEIASSFDFSGDFFSFLKKPLKKDVTESLLKRNGFIISRNYIRYDGNCQFASISDQLYGNTKCHREIRSACVDWLKKNPNFVLKNKSRIKDFVYSEKWGEFLKRMDQDGEWGNHLTLLAFAQMAKCRVVVLSTFDEKGQFDEILPVNEKHRKTIYLAFLHKKFHYISIHSTL